MFTAWICGKKFLKYATRSILLSGLPVVKSFIHLLWYFFQQLSSWHCIRDIYVLNVLILKMLILFILNRYAVKTEGMKPYCPYYSQTRHSLLLFLSASRFASHILLCNFIFHVEVIIWSYAEAGHESDSNFSSILYQRFTQKVNLWRCCLGMVHMWPTKC